MAEPGQKFQHVERELVGEPLAIGERVIRPVARLRGWVGADGGPHGGWGGGWLRVQPIAVIVREADGAENRVSITAEANQALRNMIMGGLAVAGICLAIMMLRELASRVVRHSAV